MSVAVGALMAAAGMSLILFSSDLNINSIGVSEEIRQLVESVVKDYSYRGFVFMVIGFIVLIVPTILMMCRNNKDEVKKD